MHPLLCSAPGSGAVNVDPPVNSAPEEEVVQSHSEEFENKAVLNPRLLVEEKVAEDPENQAGGNRASIDGSR